MNWPNKLECYITVGWNGLPGAKHGCILGLIVSYEENECCTSPEIVFTMLYLLLKL